MRGVSDGSEVFQNGERRSQTFRLRLKHRKLAFATDQHVPVKRGHQNPRHTTGAPSDNFRENICSEDDLRSRIFGTFVVKFLACLPLLGFSNI